MDELNQDKNFSEGDEGRELGLRLVGAQGNALDAFELPDGLLDLGATSVESAGERAWRARRRWPCTV